MGELQSLEESWINAAEEGNSKALQCMIVARYDVNYRTDEGETALHIACRCNNPGIVRQLAVSGSDVHTDDANKIAPIHWAARNGDREILQVLLNNHAVFNAPGFDGRTPAEEASRNGHQAIV